MELKDLRLAFQSAASADTSTLRPDSASVRRFLESSYVPMLLAEAYAMRDSGLVRPGDLNALDMFKESLYRDGLRERLLPKYIQMDEKVLRQVYENMKTQLELAVIRVPTLVEVDTVRADLARGSAFEQVARYRSRDRSTSALGGSMGWVDATRFPPDQQKVLWSLPVGAVSPTVSDPSSHSIYKILARRDGPPLKGFEEERPEILRALATKQMSRVAVEIHDDLMAQYHYRVDPDSAEWIRAFLEKETAAARRTYDPAVDKERVRLDQPSEKPFWSEAPLKGADARKAISYIDGDTLRALEVIDQLVFEPTLVWPKFESVSDVNELCDEAFWERVQNREAIRLGVEQDPEFIRKVTNRRGFLAWRAYRRDILLPKINPSDAEVETLYNQTIQRFHLPERRRYVAIGTQSEDLARQAGDLLRKGMAPSTAGRQLKEGMPSLTIAVTPDTGMGLVRRGDSPELDATIFGLAKGVVSDPVPDRGGYAVIRVDEILPARTQSLEEVRTALQNEILSKREKEAILDVSQKARSSIKAVIDPNALSNMDFKLSVFEERGKPRKP
jgi:parvulin-like peptidyl-prolyl isomerase